MLDCPASKKGVTERILQPDRRDAQGLHRAGHICLIDPAAAASCNRSRCAGHDHPDSARAGYCLPHRARPSLGPPLVALDRKPSLDPHSCQDCKGTKARHGTPKHRKPPNTHTASRWQKAIVCSTADLATMSLDHPH